MADDRARSPKGWTGPKEVDGLKVEGFWRAHQVPIGDPRGNPEHLASSINGCGAISPRRCLMNAVAGRGIEKLAPEGDAADGRQSACQRRSIEARTATAELSRFRGRCAKARRRIDERRARWVVLCARFSSTNAEDRNFRIMGPDETASNRLDAVFETTDRVWMETIEPYDVHLSRDGRVMEVLSEHLCQGWLEGYLLTGRHGLFSCYEAFIHIVDSMFNQHAKWLKVSRSLPWRRPIASLNYLLTSTSGARTTTASATRIRASSTRHQQEGRHRPHLFAA